MDPEYIKQIAVIETKIDLLLQNDERTNGIHSMHENRIGVLEDAKHWAIGVGVGLSILSAAAMWSIKGSLNYTVSSYLKETDLTKYLCDDYKQGKRIPVELLPKICQ